MEGGGEVRGGCLFEACMDLIIHRVDGSNG